MENTLLIVDDEQPILNALSRVFRRTSISVITANTASQALAYVREQPIGVLLCDYNMPDMSGATLLAKIKTIQPDTVKLILSGNNDQAAVINSINVGEASKFLSKPWDDSNLVHEVEQAFKRYHANRHVSDCPLLLTPVALQDQFLQFAKQNDDELTVALIKRTGTSSELQKAQAAMSHRDICGHLQQYFEARSIEYAAGLLDNNTYCVCFSGNNSQPAPLDQLQYELPTHLTLDDFKIKIRHAIGYARGTTRGRSFEKYQEMARVALSEAEHLQNATAVEYSDRQASQQRRHLELEARLYAAIDKQQLQLHYQPKISLADGRMAGAEALLRWQCPPFGAISPAEFIPLAESNGLIEPITHWVLAEATTQWHRWFSAASGQPKISVNLSAQQLSDKDLTHRIEHLLANVGLNAAQLELELTESCLVQDLQGALKQLRDLKTLGVLLSIDDFGTGYSSLSYLNQLPIDIIKIDRSFISHIDTDSRQKKLVEHTIALAKDLDKEIVAEGVETEEQLRILRDLGCDLIQGFYFSKPLTSQSFEQSYVRESLSIHDPGFLGPNINAS